VKSDIDLVNAVLNGEREAFEPLVRRYERLVWACALRVMHNHQQVEDVVQQSFYTAYRTLGSLRKGSSFGPWIAKIATRTATRSRQKLDRESPTDAQTIEQAASSNGKLDDGHARLLDAVGQLPKHENVVVTLRYFDGHSVQTIAELTGRPLGTVTKQLSRAHDRLRLKLRES